MAARLVCLPGGWDGFWLQILVCWGIMIVKRFRHVDNIIKAKHYYLAQNLWFWTGIIFIRVYVSVCVSVCLWVCSQIISKSSWPILMKLGRIVYNDKRQVPFEDELNRPIRTKVRDHFSFWWKRLDFGLTKSWHFLSRRQSVYIQSEPTEDHRRLWLQTK